MSITTRPFYVSITISRKRVLILSYIIWFSDKHLDRIKGIYIQLLNIFLPVSSKLLHIRYNLLFEPKT